MVVNSWKYKKKEFYERKIDEHKNDSKEMWKTLKNLIKGKHREIKFDSVRFSIQGSVSFAKTEEEAANKLNNYFVNSICEIANSIPQTED